MTLDEFIAEWQNDDGCVLVHTSGSTGRPKPMWVEKRRMEASARITSAFLGLKPGDTALLCMPLDYIAGKMMVVRALTCGLRLITIEPSGHPMKHLLLLESQHFVELSPETDDKRKLFAAMTPMQVYNSLQVPEERERLQQIDQLIIGGGAIDKQLEEALRAFPNAVWSTYGMTETLSHIALRRLNGPDASEWYTPLDSVSVWTEDDNCLRIHAPLVAPQVIKTNDIAKVEGGRFKIIGRQDNVICSGGIKIQIEDVERLLRQHTDVSFLITKAKDVKFGEVVAILLENGNIADIQVVCEQYLPKYWQPRLFFQTDRLPMTMTGKPARLEAERLVSRLRDQES